MPLSIPVAIAARISNGNIITGVWWLSLSCENCILKFKFKMLIHHIYVILQCFICNWILHLFKMKSNAMRCHAHRNADISAFKYFEDSEWHEQQIHAMARKSVARATTQQDIHTYPAVSSTNLMWIFKETNNISKETLCSSGGCSCT